MHYPLTFSFKILALAPQIAVHDAQGQLLLYVKQKLLKLKEAVTVFADETQSRPLFYINADRYLDISARYHITDAQGRSLGAVQRHGMRSLWKAHYEILAGESPLLTIREENPWIKVLDGLVGEIPIVGLFTGLLFQPAYLVTRQDGALALRLAKRRSLLESEFRVEQHAPLEPAQEQLALLGILMMILLERTRG
jgi:uncharacterized protein YxjI